ncbi:hypothetical protein BJ508DRAFT_15043 [Ascobolus immersus RN42]|uniref:Uncharacterized protein n=1 Tax=Ascobolus immersus RN42 TaxID=1160509 RepID=A0A3N4HQ68_ASCIM|nr:hypothetical protein BJ508DRAFT_15043 [Ascobolus immersus RN42]
MCGVAATFSARNDLSLTIPQHVSHLSLLSLLPPFSPPSTPSSTPPSIPPLSLTICSTTLLTFSSNVSHRHSRPPLLLQHFPTKVVGDRLNRLYRCLGQSFSSCSAPRRKVSIQVLFCSLCPLRSPTTRVHDVPALSSSSPPSFSPPFSFSSPISQPKSLVIFAAVSISPHWSSRLVLLFDSSTLLYLFARYDHPPTSTRSALVTLSLPPALLLEESQEVLSSPSLSFDHKQHTITNRLAKLDRPDSRVLARSASTRLPSILKHPVRCRAVRLER